MALIWVGKADQEVFVLAKSVTQSLIIGKAAFLLPFCLLDQIWTVFRMEDTFKKKVVLWQSFRWRTVLPKTGYVVAQGEELLSLHRICTRLSSIGRTAPQWLLTSLGWHMRDSSHVFIRDNILNWVCLDRPPVKLPPFPLNSALPCRC